MKKISGLLIFCVLLFFVIRGLWISELSPASSDKTLQPFVISKGESFTDITKDLSKASLIKSSFVFSTYAKRSGAVEKVQAGTFKLSPSMSVEEILKTISANPVDNWVTLLEGWRVEEMADKLNDVIGLDRKAFLKVAKEGFMFPDTYLFPKEYSAQQITKIMQDNFNQKYSADLKTKIKSKGLTENDGVILASIVEREARSQEVRTAVASILLKRLKINMGLNVDSSIQYALGYQPSEKSWWKMDLTKDDLKVESPYNTYLYRGLPPTPICNPSLSSLQAVASADSSTPYLYYYHDSKGNSYYAKTLEEHNANVANHP